MAMMCVGGQRHKPKKEKGHEHRTSDSQNKAPSCVGGKKINLHQKQISSKSKRRRKQPKLCWEVWVCLSCQYQTQKKGAKPPNNTRKTKMSTQVVLGRKSSTKGKSECNSIWCNHSKRQEKKKTRKNLTNQQCGKPCQRNTINFATIH